MTADGVPVLRLPRTFTPTAYVARLALDPARTDFSGEIAITGTIATASRTLWLHGKGLSISQASIQVGGAEEPIEVTPVGEEMLRVTSQRELPVGEATLRITYKGTLDTVATAGAFRQTTGSHAYVFSQFEALYARRVFPCLDEPDNKVPWTLTLDVPVKHVAVSNTPITTEVVMSGVKRVTFARTKPLPSYLVAFGVGPFEIVDAGKTTRGTPVRVITFAGRANDAGYAAATGAKILEAAEAWFGTPYPYEKLDLMTIPVTVGFGAMENAGLITFTESLMLLEQTAARRKQWSWISVASHEIAHQWFGNLVTTAWWDDIWLNEGFANWVQTKIIAAVEPSWHAELGILDMRNWAMDADSLVTARQVRQPIVQNGDILNAFDGITYNKGASLLSMFEQLVGPDVFQRGVRAYLAAHQWGNATSSDFANEIARASGKPVLATAFAGFLDQPGVPQITATVDCGTTPTIELAQRRYLPPGAASASASTPWTIPVCVSYDAGGKRASTCTLLDAPSTRITLRSCPRWVMPNVDGKGYYRVAYTPKQLTALRDEAWPLLSWLERRAIVSDANVAATAGTVPLPLALSFTPKMLAGTDRYALQDAAYLPDDLDHWVPDALRPRYEHWIQRTFGPAARASGFLPAANAAPESLDDEVRRENVLSLVAWNGRDPALVAEAVSLAARWRTLPQNIRGLVLRVAVDASPALFDRVLDEVYREPERTKRTEMFDALARVRDPARQKRALALMIDKRIDFREAMTMPYKTSTDAARETAQKFFQANEKILIGRMPTDGSTFSIGSYAKLFITHCRSDQRAATAKYVEHFASFPGGERPVRQALEAMDQCIAERALVAPELSAWLGGIRIIAEPGDKPAKADPPKKSGKKKRGKKR